MISAKEAKERTANSAAVVNRYIEEKVKPAVIASADQGLNSCRILIGTVYSYELVECSAVERNILSILKDLGYTASIEPYGEPYVPRGLQDEEGQGPKVRNYGFLILW